MSEFPGMLADVAAEFGPEIARRFGARYAGCRFEVPCQRTQYLAARDAAICREFNGRNIAELCERYGLSRWQIYRILKKK